MKITEFLLARIAEDEAVARDLLTDLEGEVREDWADQSDECGPMTPDRLLSAQMWAQYAGQSKRRSFARGQQIARLASPARVLAECAAKRAIIHLREFLDRTGGTSDWHSGYSDGNGDALLQLAVVYKDHPDYDGTWKL